MSRRRVMVGSLAAASGVVTGCGAHVAKLRLTKPETLAAQGQALVLMGFDIDLPPSLLQPSSRDATGVWLPRHVTTYDEKTPISKFGGFHSSSLQSALEPATNEVKPSTYRLHHFWYYHSRAIHSYTGTDVTVAQFTINVGEVLYVGHLRGTVAQNEVAFRVEDRFEQVRKFTKQHAPALHKALTARLMTAHTGRLSAIPQAA